MNDSSRLILKNDVWYSLQMLPGYHSSLSPYYSPIKVQEINPLKTGKSILRIRFLNVGYAHGAQDFEKEIRIIKHSENYLIANLIDSPERAYVIGEIGEKWISRHLDLSDRAKEKLVEYEFEEIQDFLNDIFLGIKISHNPKVGIKKLPEVNSDQQKIDEFALQYNAYETVGMNKGIRLSNKRWDEYYEGRVSDYSNLENLRTCLFFEVRGIHWADYGLKPNHENYLRHLIYLTRRCLVESENDFKKLKLMTLNILSGGGKRIIEISKKIESHNPDVLILSEFRLGKSWNLLQEKLRAMGFAIYDYNIKEEKINSVMIASKLPAKKIGTPNLPESELHRLCGLKVFGIKILGVYFAQKEKKKPFFNYFLDDPDHLIGGQTIIMGDINTGLNEDNSTGKGFYCKDQFNELTSSKTIDLWRKRNKNKKEYSWMHKKYGNQFRIDHALGTKEIDKMTKSVFYSHDERNKNVTDHSALLLEIHVPKK